MDWREGPAPRAGPRLGATRGCHAHAEGTTRCEVSGAERYEVSRHMALQGVYLGRSENRGARVTSFERALLFWGIIEEDVTIQDVTIQDVTEEARQSRASQNPRAY